MTALIGSLNKAQARGDFSRAPKVGWFVGFDRSRWTYCAKIYWGLNPGYEMGERIYRHVRGVHFSVEHWRNLRFSLRNMLRFER